MSDDRAPAPDLAPPDVVGPGEVIALLGISRQAFHAHHKTRPDFPPATRLECGDVYERRAIVAYAKQRATGRPYLDALRIYREHARALTPYGACALAAQVLPIGPTTVRRYLQQLGEIPR